MLTAQCRSGYASQFRDGHVPLRSHIIGSHGLATSQNRPQPDRQIGAIKIRTMWGSIALNVHSAPGEAIADEISNSEVGVQRQVRADKGEAPRDHAFDRMLTR